MANEFTLSIFCKNENDGITVSSGTLRFDQTGTAPFANEQVVGTTREQLTIGADVSTPGFALFRNRDATNFVEVGPTNDDTSYFLKLKAGEWAIMRLASTTLYARADTANVKLWYKIYDD